MKSIMQNKNVNMKIDVLEMFQQFSKSLRVFLLLVFTWTHSQFVWMFWY